MKISRMVVIVLGLCAVAIALSKNRAIFWFVLFSWAGLGASFAPSLILSVFWKRLSSVGVIASTIIGFSTTMIWKVWLRGLIKEGAGVDIYELVPAFILAFAAAIIFSYVYPKKEADHKPADPLDSIQ